MKKNLLIIIILSVFTNNCYTTTSEITLAANEEYQKLKDIKYEKTLGVKNAASYGFKGFYENPKSDFAISYYDSTECDTWYSEHLFWLALAIFPNRENVLRIIKLNHLIRIRGEILSFLSLTIGIIGSVSPYYGNFILRYPIRSKDRKRHWKHLLLKRFMMTFWF